MKSGITTTNTLEQTQEPQTLDYNKNVGMTHLQCVIPEISETIIKCLISETII